jgi:hypothetical protein
MARGREPLKMAMWALPGLMLLLLLLLPLAATGSIQHPHQPHHTPKHFTLAFVGDQGYGLHAQAVLKLVRDSGAAGVVLSGDFDYRDDPPLFLEQLESTLGRRFPLFPAIGNHDVARWNGTDGYQPLFARHQRRARLAAHCYGELGIHHACVWHGVLVLSSGIGTLGSGHAAFLEAALVKHADVPWKICSFHKNQHAYQTDGGAWRCVWGGTFGCAWAQTTSHIHEHTHTHTHTPQTSQTRRGTRCMRCADATGPSSPRPMTTATRAPT